MGDRDGDETIARRSLELAGTFEAEVLVWLMLGKWDHPLAADEEFRDNLLEAASSVLAGSVDGQRLFDTVSPANVNLIAALWYAEATTLAGDSSIAAEERRERYAWLEAVRRTIPSCFCEPDELL